MRKQKTGAGQQKEAPKWRYFTLDGKRKRELKIAKFTGEIAQALKDDTAVIVSYTRTPGVFELRLEQELDLLNQALREGLKVD